MITGQSDQAWRLRIRVPEGCPDTGNVLGAGFVVTEGVGFTCAHVVDGLDHCWVDVPSMPGEMHQCEVRKLDPTWQASSPAWSDVAMITLPPHLPPAPLGPAELPRPGAVLDALGFPERYQRAGDRGQRTRVWTVGPDETGKLVQVDGLLGTHGQIQPGYSGGAAVEVTSQRVVGMIVSNDQLRPLPSASTTAGLAKLAANQPDLLKIAWIIPLPTLVESWPALRALLPANITVDPQFLHALSELHHGSYTQALARLNALVTVYPREVDMYYYRVLAGLCGVRPGGYAAPTIQAVERLLQAALQLNPSAAHVSALWAVVKEDYYYMRGLPEGQPSAADLRLAVDHVDRRRAEEILRHVPAYECPTWQRLEQNRGQR